MLHKSNILRSKYDLTWSDFKWYTYQVLIKYSTDLIIDNVSIFCFCNKSSYKWNARNMSVSITLTEYVYEHELTYNSTLLLSRVHLDIINVRTCDNCETHMRTEYIKYLVLWFKVNVFGQTFFIDIHMFTYF